MFLFPHPVPLGSPVDVFMIGGTLFLRGQRNRQQFILMQAALEKGITSFPGQAPFWLISLRQGVITITLGIALLIVGAGAWGIGHSVQQPTAILANEPLPPPPQPADGPPGEWRRPPPPRNPIVQQWLRAQMEETLGQIAVGCGIILLLVGIARTGFAGTERRYSETTAPPK
jgi:hypothetical protein